MPYTNIVWIKLQIEILNDKRFIYDLNETQRYMFIGLLLLAGSTKNHIPDDEMYIKNRLNLGVSAQEVRKNLDFIYKVFPKTVVSNGHAKFINFNELHNQIRDSQRISEGKPKDRKIREDKIRKEQIDRVIKTFVTAKDWDLTNPALLGDTYRRYGKAAKNLCLIADNDEKAVEAINWLKDEFSKKGLNWTLETVVKWYPEFTKKSVDKWGMI